MTTLNRAKMEPQAQTGRAKHAFALGRAVYLGKTKDGREPVTVSTLSRSDRDIRYYGDSDDNLDIGPELAEMLRRESLFLVARIQKSYAGYCKLSIHNRGSTAVVQMLYVLPKRRKNGIGRCLINSAIKSADEMGVSRMILNPTNDIAARLYTAAGFIKTETGGMERGSRDPGRHSVSRR